MFRLTQRGQIIADSHGWPVIIARYDHRTVRYCRQEIIDMANLKHFKKDFEPPTHEDEHQMRADLETSEYIKKLRAQAAASAQTM